MYLNDLFLFLNEIDVCNFDNNTTLSMCHKNLAELFEKFLKNSELAIHWFEDNYVSVNIGICLVKNSLSHYLEHNFNIAKLSFKLKMAHPLHHQNIEALETEMFKFYHGFSSLFSGFVLYL